MKYSWVDVKNKDFEQLFRECPEGAYIVVNPEETKAIKFLYYQNRIWQKQTAFLLCVQEQFLDLLTIWRISIE